MVHLKVYRRHKTVINYKNIIIHNKMTLRKSNNQVGLTLFIHNVAGK